MKFKPARKVNLTAPSAAIKTVHSTDPDTVVFFACPQCWAKATLRISEAGTPPKCKKCRKAMQRTVEKPTIVDETTPLPLDPERLAADDAANRTPDAELSHYEREDVPEEAYPSCICPKCDQIAEHGHICDPDDLEGEQSPDPMGHAQGVTSPLTRTASVVSVAPIATPHAPDAQTSSGKPSLADRLNQSLARGCSTPPHVIVIAKAGVGKTTMLVEGLKRLRGLPVSITPSAQQQAIWDAMDLSKGARTICFAAFSKAIQLVLKDRVPGGCDCMTMHSMGLKAIRKVFTLKPGQHAVNEYRTRDLISEVLGVDLRELRATKPVMLQATEKLVGHCKKSLVELTGEVEDYDTLWDLADRYDVDLRSETGVSYVDEVFALVPRVLARARDVGRDKCVDYDDMIWLPLVLDLPLFRYDLLLVDEGQDLSRAQQALALRAGRRTILVGDPKQAIFSFAGADSESIPRMQAQLQATDSGVSVLPLTVTRRCGKAIVKVAQQKVPDFTAHEDNPLGEVLHAKYPIQYRTGSSGELEAYEIPWEDTYLAQVRRNDMILCRVNAPLVSQCFRLIKRGISAKIQGRDIGKGLVTLIQKFDVSKVSDLRAKVYDWLRREEEAEQAKRNPSESRLIGLHDKADCIFALMEGCATTAEVVGKIESVFTDDKGMGAVWLSSIHRAKGLEARRVFFLMPRGGECPHPLAKSDWQMESEDNLWYVAVTRAIETLVFVK